MFLSEIIDLYLPHCRRESSQRTYVDRAKILEDLKLHLGQLTTEQVRGMHLTSWLYSHERWQSDWTLRRVLATVQACMNWSCRHGLITQNPFRGISHRSGEHGKPMDPRHFQALLRKASPLFRRVLIFLRYTGARPCEMAALEWDFIDPERGVIVLHRHKTRRTQLTQRPRIIVLHPVICKLLCWILEHQPHEKRVFLNGRGRPWTRSNLALRMARLRERAQVPSTVKMYSLRHSFGTEAVRRGIDLKTLSELMGHTTTRITETYVHIAGEVDHLEAAVKRIFGPRAC